MNYIILGDSCEYYVASLYSSTFPLVVNSCCREEFPWLSTPVASTHSVARAFLYLIPPGSVHTKIVH